MRLQMNILQDVEETISELQNKYIYENINYWRCRIRRQPPGR